MKTGERIVRGRQASVNRSIATALCMVAENVAKLFRRKKRGAIARASLTTCDDKLRLRFFFDEHFDFGDDVAEDFDLYRVFAEGFEWFS